MSSSASVVRFHGMIVISDQDCVSVKGKDVIEVNSSGDLVCRWYDENGLEETNPPKIDLVEFLAVNLATGKKLTESSITAFIQREVGSNDILISKSAIDMINSFLSV